MKTALPELSGVAPFRRAPPGCFALLAWAACLAVSSGCATPPVETPPSLALPASFRGTAAPLAGSSTDSTAWWRLFNDPSLDDLIARAERSNTDLAQALARVAESRALQQAGHAAMQPQLGLQAGLTRQGGPLVNAAGDSGTLATALLGLSAEVDLSGRPAGADRAASLDTQAREALAQAVRLQVQVAVADTVLTLSALRAEERLLEQELAGARARLNRAEARQLLGTVPERELQRQRAELAERTSALPALARRREQLLHALATLVGEPASSFEMPAPLEGPDAQAAPALLPALPPGLPSQMLQRRADVQAAARALSAAQARAGVAQAAWFPSLQLTAAGGQASTDLRHLLQAAMGAWSLGALVALPLLDGGRRDAQAALARAEVQAAEAAWRGQVLQALREVEDQLSRQSELRARQALQQQAEAAAGRLAALTESRRRTGLASELEASRAQGEWLRSRQRGWQLQAERAQATVALVRALGGGWPGLDAGAMPAPADAAAAAPQTAAVAAR